ncbi:MAG: glycosyltransferase family 4 protein [Calothrix sp. C42_A2020_038]|nr:glycosyltransferase family 4 protein [Calothrix sp. C42_A2020_038]
MKIFMLSNLGKNPYNELLIKHLIKGGAKVESEDDHQGIIFLPQVIKNGSHQILHLHKLHYFFLGKTGNSKLFLYRDEIWRPFKFLIFEIQILMLKLTGTKVVCTIHEWEDKIEQGKQSIPPNFLPKLGRLFDALIVHCDTTKQQLLKAFGSDVLNKVFVVEHGNYISSYPNSISRDSARKTLGIKDENLTFLLFGNIFRSKGFLEAIDNFKKLNQDNLFLIVAGYPAESGIENLIRGKIQGCENILFVPQKVPDQEIQVYMNASDCVILPYKIFTTSGVTLLAMSFGKACIAPNSGYFSDLLDKQGAFLYNPAQDDGLLHVMKEAIEKQDILVDMGQHNFKLAQKWNWDYVAQKTLEVYKNV